MKLRLLGMTAALIVTVFCGSAVAHPYHVTLAEAELEKSTGKLEVALKVKPEDLERALSAMSKRKISLEKEKKVDALILQYLQSRLKFFISKNKAAAMSFIGKEGKLKALWLYFEVDLKGKLEGISVEHRIFFEVLPDQMNTINFKQGKKRGSLTFSRKFPKRTVQLKIPAPPKKKKD